MAVCVVNALHFLTLVMFSVSVYKICVQSEKAPESSNSALTLVPNEDPEDDGVQIDVENNEIDYDQDLVFYPTKEWQTVKKNQAIPAGLHVRLNMETGEKEAKLMDGDDGMKYWKNGEKQGIVNPKKKYFTHQDLKDALKEFKAEAEDEETTRRREASIKKKFKKYEELKKDLQSMEVNIKTDGEIITTLVEKLKLSDLSNADRLSTLTNLEYYLHQVDNAQMFCDMGGMPFLVQLLNHTDGMLRAASAHVIGSATQSNPKVQVETLEAGCLPQLIRLVSTDKLSSVKRRSLFALSSLVRNFPFAQQKLLQFGGLTVLSQLFKDKANEKLQLKAITLLNDLLQEQFYIGKLDPDEPGVQMRQEQYKEVPLLKMMLDDGWCDLIPTLLGSSDHDTREKVISTMVTLRENCYPNFNKVSPLIENLKLEYQELAQEEINNSEDGYFSTILDKLKKLQVKIHLKHEL